MQPSHQPIASRGSIDSCKFSSSSSSDDDTTDGEWVTVTESESNLVRVACRSMPPVVADASSWLILDDNSRFVHDDAGRLIIRQITHQPTADLRLAPACGATLSTPVDDSRDEVDIAPHLNNETEPSDSINDLEEEETEEYANDDEDDSEWILSKIHSRRHVKKNSNTEQKTLRFRCEEADYDDDGSAYVDTYEYLCSWKGHSERTWELRSTLESMDCCVKVDLYDQEQIRQACARRGQTTATTSTGTMRASILSHPYHHPVQHSVEFEYLFYRAAQQMLHTKLRDMNLSVFSQESIEDRPLQHWCVCLYLKSWAAAAAAPASSEKVSLALAFEAMQPRDVATAVSRMKASLSAKMSQGNADTRMTPLPAADATFHTAILKGNGILVSLVLVRTMHSGEDKRIRCVAPMWYIRVCPTSASPHAGEVCHSKRELKQQPRRVKDFYR